MTRTWKLEEAKTHFSQLIREAEQEPQVITRHGRPVAVVSAAANGTGMAMKAGGQGAQRSHPQSALDALRGDFDFSDMPDEDLFQRDRSSDLRDLNL